jgi:hypothetical protein
MESDKEHNPLKEIANFSITFRLCKWTFPHGIKGTFWAFFPKEILGLILYHLGIVYLHKLCLVDKASYEHLNPLGGCIVACCDKNDIDYDLLDLQYERFETFLYWYIFKYGGQTTTITTIFGLILCCDDRPWQMDSEQLHYASFPKNKFRLQFNEYKNLIGLNSVYYSDSSHSSLNDICIKIQRRCNKSKPPEYLSMDFTLNTRPEVLISLKGINYFHMNISSGHTDLKNRQDDALATDKSIEDYFIQKKGKNPMYVVSYAIIRIHHCYDLNDV